jgi:hypothetical protein
MKRRDRPRECPRGFDLFNVFNGNVDLQRERNAASPNYYRLNQILSPRILRIGMRLTFR